ncbi:MAG: hypothetical protein WC222_05650 [Parachlamydiales bacterium]|jgi:hypothetical protein
MGQIICFFGLAFFLTLNTLFTLPYIKPAHVAQEVWDVMQPLFLPENHSLRNKLDKIFNRGRPTANKISLLKAGFTHLKIGSISQTTVAKHPKLRDYVLKLFTDDVAFSEWEPLKKRVDASISVSKTVENLGYNSIFVIPKKWIYPLPASSTPADNAILPKNFIVIAEEIDITGKYENLRIWHDRVDKRMLIALHHLVAIEGLDDSVLPRNIPFTKNGKKIALVDLEHHQQWPIPYHKLLRFLNPRMGVFWSNIQH